MRQFCTDHKILFFIVLGAAYIVLGRLMKGIAERLSPDYGWLIFEILFLIGFAFLVVFIVRFTRIKDGN